MFTILLIGGVVIAAVVFLLFGLRKGADSQTAMKDRPPLPQATPEKRAPGLD